jgi:hypothetical protein
MEDNKILRKIIREGLQKEFDKLREALAIRNKAGLPSTANPEKGNILVNEENNEGSASETIRMTSNLEL